MTAEEMIAALEEIVGKQDDPTGFYTVEEWSEMLGLGETATQKRLKAAQRAGRLEVVKVKRPSIDGRLMLSYGYRILPA
jgi:hypothetical protein